MGTEVTRAITDPEGGFSLSTGSYTGPVLLQVSGGTYVDEATGATMAMLPGDVMTAVVAAMMGGGGMMGGGSGIMMPSTAGTSGLATVMMVFMDSAMNRWAHVRGRQCARAAAGAV